MDRKKRSLIWLLSSDEFAKVVHDSKSIAEICRYFGFATTGRCHKSIRERISQENIDISHIPLGVGHNKGISRPYKKKKSLEEILVENSTYNVGNLKQRLIRESLLKEQCAICMIGPIWNDEKLVLIIDHINGIRDDNRLHNLRLLCPNCNSQTKTFSGRNAKREPKRKCPYCLDVFIKNKHDSCWSCYKKRISQYNPRKFEIPKDVLCSMVQKYSLTYIGNEYGVSGNAVKKRCKAMGVEIPQKKSTLSIENSKVVDASLA